MYVYKSTVESRVTNAHHGSRSPAGLRRLGTATRMSASLFRRHSAFFESASGQDPKAAKFAVLTPGRAGFPKHAKRSEGRDTTPHPKRPLFRRVSPCVRSLSESRVVSTFTRESKRGPLVREIEKRDKKRLGIKFMAAALPDFLPLLI